MNAVIHVKCQKVIHLYSHTRIQLYIHKCTNTEIPYYRNLVLHEGSNTKEGSYTVKQYYTNTDLLLSYSNTAIQSHTHTLTHSYTDVDVHFSIHPAGHPLHASQALFRSHFFACRCSSQAQCSRGFTISFVQRHRNKECPHRRRHHRQHRCRCLNPRRTSYPCQLH